MSDDSKNAARVSGGRRGPSLAETFESEAAEHGFGPRVGPLIHVASIETELNRRHTTLPEDSAARKEIPLHLGLLRYFPAALLAAAEAREDLEDLSFEGSADRVVVTLMRVDESEAFEDYDRARPLVGMLARAALELAQNWLEAHDGAPHALPGQIEGTRLFAGLFCYYPAALAAAARVSKVGNDKHNPGQELHHARGKSMDHSDCILRHMIDLQEDFGAGVGYDEAGMPQAGYIAWRALAFAQQWLEDHASARLAPAARLP